MLQKCMQQCKGEDIEDLIAKLLKIDIYPTQLSKPPFAVYSRAPNENPLPPVIFSPKAIINYFEDRRIKSKKLNLIL